MNWLQLPWTEIAIVTPILGGLIVTLIPNIELAGKWTFSVTLLTLVATLLALVAVHNTVPDTGLDLCGNWFGRCIFRLDTFSAPLLPMVAILHVLTVLATSQVKRNRMSFAGHLFGEGLRLAVFACIDPWPLIALLTLSVVPPYFELVSRGKPTRIFVLHMGAFIALLILGWLGVEAGLTVGSIFLVLAVLLRSGTLPGHLWVANLFEHATFGTALLFVTPITGMYVAVRLVLPNSPDWVLQSIGIVSLITAIYAAGMAVVQRDGRRFIAYLFLSNASLVLIGLELHTTTSLTGALCLWVSVALSLGGLGLTMRALEARFGRLSLTTHLGLYDQAPTLAVGFLLMGLASVGFPGTLGFVAAEMLLDGVINANPVIGVGLIFVAALNGIAVLRAYTLLFTGCSPRTNLLLNSTTPERIAVLVLASMVLIGGLWPAPGVSDRRAAAVQILHLAESNQAVGHE